MILFELSEQSISGYVLRSIHFMFDYLDYLDDSEEVRYRKPRNTPKRNRAEIVAELVEQADDTREGFNPSFHSSRHERAWILSYLGGFYEDHMITDVLRQVKGGKQHYR